MDVVVQTMKFYVFLIEFDQIQMFSTGCDGKFLSFQPEGEEVLYILEI